MEKQAGMPPSRNQILRKVFLLLLPTLLCLFLLTDHETTDNSERSRHLAVFSALARHPPSMRIFRCLLGFCLVGFCTAFSLFMYQGIVDKEMIRRLLFDTPYTLMEGERQDLEYELSTFESSQGISSFDKYDDGFDEDEANGNHNDDSEEDDHDKCGEHNDREDDVVHDTHECPDKVELPPIPSPRSILNSSLDFLLLILFTLFLFTLSSSGGGHYVDQKTPSIANNIGSIAAPLFPLFLFGICVVRLFLPWNRTREHFWTILAYTVGAPFYKVTFRDGFVGDIFTSMVRPLQDMAFTSFYILCGLQGYWRYHQNVSEEEHVLPPLESNWWLHTLVLPTCMISPLWWRYSQTLRQVWEHKKRWPYLGNSAKYFFAAQIAMWGVFDPRKTESKIWISGFILSTLYQIWWDVFQDWELLVWSPDSQVRFELRTKRLYSSKGMYYGILIGNICLRFGWALTFLPRRYLSPSGALLDTFSADFDTFVAPTLAFAEIIRRTMWGLIRFELEVLKEKERENQARVLEESQMQDMELSLEYNGMEMEPMTIASSNKSQRKFNGWTTSTLSLIFNDISIANEVQILWELCSYGMIFTSLGVMAAVHRYVM